MTRTSARAKKSKQDVNKKKEETKQPDPDDNQIDSDIAAGESTDKENNDSNYDVEKITHTRLFKGKRQYLVRWKGYTEESDTWENESTLQSCKDILEAYKKENLSEERSDNEETDESVKGKDKKAAKKAKKSSTKVTKKSSKTSKVKKVNVEVEQDDETEEEATQEVKEENSEEEPVKKSDETHAGNKKTSKKKETKGKKRKSITESASSVAKKEKKVESDDESITDGKDYEVEKVIEVHTKKDGSREFLIRWKGYRPSDDTWEPEEHLNCQELIDKFMEKVDKAKEITAKKLRNRTETKRFVPLGTRRVAQRNSGLRPCYNESGYED